MKYIWLRKGQNKRLSLVLIYWWFMAKCARKYSWKITEDHRLLQPVAKVLEESIVFWHKWSVCDLVLVIPPPPLIKVARNTRPCSKLGRTTLNGREEGGQYHISQTCDQQRFEARKVVFSWECLNISATGCSFAVVRKLKEGTPIEG